MAETDINNPFRNGTGCPLCKPGRGCNRPNRAEGGLHSPEATPLPGETPLAPDPAGGRTTSETR